jgi:hypothetical protein
MIDGDGGGELRIVIPQRQLDLIESALFAV